MGFWRGAIIRGTGFGLDRRGGTSARPGGDYSGDFCSRTEEQADRPRPTCHQATPEQRAAAEAALAAFDSPTLTRFAERGRVPPLSRRGARRSSARAAAGMPRSRRPIQFAQAQTGGQSDAVEPICPDTDPQCGAPAERRQRHHGHRQPRSPAPADSVGEPRSPAPSNPDDHQQPDARRRGRRHRQADRPVSAGPPGRPHLRRRHRAPAAAAGSRSPTGSNVYRDPRENMWYDEMLVFGDRVLITGYSYRQRRDRIVGLPARPATRPAGPRGRLLHVLQRLLQLEQLCDAADRRQSRHLHAVRASTTWPGRPSAGRWCGAGARTSERAGRQRPRAAGRCSTPPRSTGRCATGRGSDRPHRLGLPARRGRRRSATSNAGPPPSSARTARNGM